MRLTIEHVQSMYDAFRDDPDLKQIEVSNNSRGITMSKVEITEKLRPLRKAKKQKAFV